MVKSEKNSKISLAMKQKWITDRDEMMSKRNSKLKFSAPLQSEKIKQHFKEHPEHGKAISNAQIKKWSRIKIALDYCKKNNINLGEDSL